MNTEQIEAQVAALLKQKIHRDIEKNSDLKSAGLDSMKAIDLLLELEEEFEITIPDEYMINDTFASMNSIVIMIDTLKNSRIS
ncbi:acyl carrier protein [Paenibacillus sp. CFBP13512]|uniref:phosphopantetheine-binding protein n=1 Tax=Paenibacillus sp. CFBP13512 TaxID=2184007 RepID=UPI0010C07E6C|nr:phosphopantetheine-binding protein [Paenibacillus sp. CFBP13512]TKJ93369.1 acyl carrier protein [Paenibacillus sp. CFBP13512]